MATSTDDFFRCRLDQMIDLRHPLAVLASRMPWQEIEASLSHRFARAAKAGKQIEDIDLFGPAAVVLSASGVSKAGRPRLPLRLMVSLLYLKHAFNESDEALVERWGETPTWQYFSGLAYFEHRWPCDPTLLVKFRKLIGEEGVEELLARTIEAAVAMKLIAKKELSTGRQFARGAVRCRVQHPLAAADDCQEGRALFADAFFAPAEAQRFDCNGAMGGEGSGEIWC